MGEIDPQVYSQSRMEHVECVIKCVILIFIPFRTVSSDKCSLLPSSLINKPADTPALVGLHIVIVLKSVGFITGSSLECGK